MLTEHVPCVKLIVLDLKSKYMEDETLVILNHLQECEDAGQTIWT